MYRYINLGLSTTRYVTTCRECTYTQTDEGHVQRIGIQCNTYSIEWIAVYPSIRQACRDNVAVYHSKAARVYTHTGVVFYENRPSQCVPLSDTRWQCSQSHSGTRWQSQCVPLPPHLSKVSAYTCVIFDNNNNVYIEAAMYNNKVANVHSNTGVLCD